MIWPALELPVLPPFPPMEAMLEDELPAAGSWTFEPKWDGFRCLVFRDGGEVALQSKAGQPLGRYFPEIVAAARSLDASKLVLDGEIVIPDRSGFSFEALLQRIHPAESRIRRLAQETPAILLCFDLLVDRLGRSLVSRPLEERRAALEQEAGRFPAQLHLSPATRERGEAEGWLEGRAGTDGVVAKRLGEPYRSGERAMVKVKRERTADCVVGGFRRGKGSSEVASLLLGLHDGEGRLHYVGHASAFARAERARLTRLAELLARAGTGAVAATGLLDGELAVEVGGGTTTIVGAALRARGAGTLKVTAPAWREYALGSIPDFAIHRRIAAALADFGYARLEAVLGPPGADPELRVTLHGIGRTVTQELDLTINLRNVRETIGAVP